MPNHRKKKHQQHGRQAPHTTKSAKAAPDENQGNGCSEEPSAPYEIKTSVIMGRYLVASKNIKAGDIMISEEPLVVGPPTGFGPVCLGCLNKVEFAKSHYRCPNCQFPLCSADCNDPSSKFGHTKWECELLREKTLIERFSKYDETDLKIGYEVLFQLRCLLLKLNDETRWQQLVELEAHNEIRKNITWLWTLNQNRVVNRIRNDWKIDVFGEEEIHTICGMIEVNCFEIGAEGSPKGRALYSTSCLMAHDCGANATHIDNPADFTMSVRAICDIKKGESITTNYGYILMGTLKRRQRLNMGKFFWCSCQRCSDPTEFGTYCSALKCSKCSNGVLLSTNPLDQDALWKCLKCSFTLDAEIVSKMLDKLFDELDALDPHDVRRQEEFIEKYTDVLGSNHYLILSAKYPLCQLYGRAEDFLVDTLTEDQLKIKEKYCRDLLKIVKVLEPGLSRTKGIIMYELHVPVMLLSCKRLEKKQISNTEFKKCLKEVVMLLEESSKILEMEPGDKEQQMIHGAQVALMSLKMQNLL